MRLEHDRVAAKEAFVSGLNGTSTVETVAVFLFPIVRYSSFRADLSLSHSSACCQLAYGIASSWAFQRGKVLDAVATVVLLASVISIVTILAQHAVFLSSISVAVLLIRSNVLSHKREQLPDELVDQFRGLLMMFTYACSAVEVANAAVRDFAYS